MLIDTNGLIPSAMHRLQGHQIVPLSLYEANIPEKILRNKHWQERGERLFNKNGH